jgi:hypothetical protein
MKRTLALCLLLAACGPGGDESAPATVADSAAMDVGGQTPVGEAPAVVQEQLDQAAKDAQARQNEVAEQVRQAEGASTP